MPEVEIRVTRVGVDAEEVELELRLDLAQARRKPRVDAETGGTHARPEVAVLAELVRKRRQLRRALDVEPIRVDLVEVVDGVPLRVPVDFHPGPPRRRDRGCGALLAPRRHLDLTFRRRRPRRSRAAEREVGDGHGAGSNSHAARQTRAEPGRLGGDVVDAGRKPLNRVAAVPARQGGRPKTGGQVAHGENGPGHRRSRAVDDSAGDGSGTGLCPGQAGQRQKKEDRGDDGGIPAWVHFGPSMNRDALMIRAANESPESTESTPEQTARKRAASRAGSRARPRVVNSRPNRLHNGPSWRTPFGELTHSSAGGARRPPRADATRF